MATLAMPSTACPAPPAVAVELPESWHRQLSAGSLIDVVFAADPQTGRLIIRHLVLASRDLVDEVISGFRTETEAQGGMADEPFEVRIDGRTARAFNTADDRTPSGTVRAVALGFFDEQPDEQADPQSHGPASGLLIIGEASGGQREDRYAEIRDMVLSASFGRLVLQSHADPEGAGDPAGGTRADHTTTHHTTTDHTTTDDTPGAEEADA